MRKSTAKIKEGRCIEQQPAGVEGYTGKHGRQDEGTRKTSQQKEESKEGESDGGRVGGGRGTRREQMA